MPKPTPEALAAAVNALYRIRAVEGPPGADGLKSVWHQCALGAELVSVVNARGQVVRQELTLLHDYFVWTPEKGLVTGAVVESGARAMANGGPVVEYDPALDSERLLSALGALSTYQGPDRYIRNVLRTMELVREGMPSEETPTITSMAPNPNDPPSDAAPGRLSGARMLLLAAVLALLAIAAAVALR